VPEPSGTTANSRKGLARQLRLGQQGEATILFHSRDAPEVEGLAESYSIGGPEFCQGQSVDHCRRPGGRHMPLQLLRFKSYG
jgi:hypothetical protein